jgi:hypothetical protein
MFASLNGSGEMDWVKIRRTCDQNEIDVIHGEEPLVAAEARERRLTSDSDSLVNTLPVPVAPVFEVFHAAFEPLTVGICIGNSDDLHAAIGFEAIGPRAAAPVAAADQADADLV